MPTEPSSTLGGKTPLGYPRGVFLIASHPGHQSKLRDTEWTRVTRTRPWRAVKVCPSPALNAPTCSPTPHGSVGNGFEGASTSCPSPRPASGPPACSHRATVEQAASSQCVLGARAVQPVASMSSHAPGRPARTVQGRACRAAPPTPRSLVARCPATAHSHSRRRVGRPCPPPPSGVPSSGSMRILRRRGCVVCSRHAFRGQPSIHCSHTDRPLPGRCPLPPSYGTNPPPRGASAPWLNACRLDAPCSWHLSVGQLRTALPIYPLPAC